MFSPLSTLPSFIWPIFFSIFAWCTADAIGPTVCYFDWRGPGKIGWNWNRKKFDRRLLQRGFASIFAENFVCRWTRRTGCLEGSRGSLIVNILGRWVRGGFNERGNFLRSMSFRLFKILFNFEASKKFILRWLFFLTFYPCGIWLVTFFMRHLTRGICLMTFGAKRPKKLY